MKYLPYFELFLVLELVLFHQTTKAQCNDSLIKTANHYYNEASVGSISWINMSNATTSDNSYAQATALIVGDITNYLVADDFNFSIPISATVCGIKVQFERSATGLLQTVEDHSIKIVKEGTITGIDAASSLVWPSTDGIYDFGDHNDAWGETWSTAHINANDFGIAISVNLAGLLVPTARIDKIQMTVYFNNPLPVELNSFNSLCTKDGVLNTWEVNSEVNNDFFTIERMTITKRFKELGIVSGAGTSNEIKKYQFFDDHVPPGDSYYRLKQTDFDGKFKYSKINHISCRSTDKKIAYPNPASKSIRFKLYDENRIDKVEIYNSNGNKLMEVNHIDFQNAEIDISSLDNGMYYYNLISNYENLKGQFIKSSY